MLAWTLTELVKKNPSWTFQAHQMQQDKKQRIQVKDKVETTAIRSSKMVCVAVKQAMLTVVFRTSHPPYYKHRCFKSLILEMVLRHQ